MVPEAIEAELPPEPKLDDEPEDRPRRRRRKRMLS
jgi:hypothetical protein